MTKEKILAEILKDPIIFYMISKNNLWDMLKGTEDD